MYDVCAMREHNIIAAGCCWKLAMVASGCENTLALAMFACSTVKFTTRAGSVGPVKKIYGVIQTSVIVK